MNISTLSLLCNLLILAGGALVAVELVNLEVDQAYVWGWGVFVGMLLTYTPEL